MQRPDENIGELAQFTIKFPSDCTIANFINGLQLHGKSEAANAILMGI